jgi:hypothetical protein
LPSTSSSYVPAPVSFWSSGNEIIYSYTPDSTGWDTLTYVQEETTGGWVTYVTVPTVNGGSTSYTE